MTKEHGDEKRSQAFRLYEEGMSGVEEELLVRSEGERGRGKILTPTFLRTASAAVVFLLVGTCFYAVNSRNVKQNSDEAGNAITYQLAGETAKDKMDERPESDFEKVPQTEYEMGNDAATEEIMQNQPEECVQDKEMLPAQNMKIASLDEARRIRDFGEYLPFSIPEGYTFESAYVTKDADTEQVLALTVLWCRGMDDFRISIQRANVSTLTITDPNQPELYAVDLYEIPYADTVPGEYLEQFMHPVFSAGDMTREIVDSRSDTHRDENDTDTPSANFGILLEDGILAEIHADMDSENLWQIVSELL